MLESSKEYRAQFLKKGAQEKWIQNIRDQLAIEDIASLCACSERTIRDWQREKFCMDYACTEVLCEHLTLPFPIVKKVDRFAHTQRAGQLGGAEIMRRYGRIPVDESIRKAAWKQWWSTVGSKKKIGLLQAKEIFFPKKSKALAEFMGIMMGDGTVAPYHIAITLNAVDDLEYSVYVAKLITKLFHVQPKIYRRKEVRALNIVVARKKLVAYVQSIGLPKGDKIKQQLSIPAWILSNAAYARACMRGLMDTDGSVFTHSYTSKGIQYSYKKLSFTSASEPLRRDVMHILKSCGITGQCSGRNIRIGSASDVQEFFRVIGSSNPKHLKRLKK